MRTCGVGQNRSTSLCALTLPYACSATREPAKKTGSPVSRARTSAMTADADMSGLVSLVGVGAGVVGVQVLVDVTALGRRLDGAVLVQPCRVDQRLAGGTVEVTLRDLLRTLHSQLVDLLVVLLDLGVQVVDLVLPLLGVLGLGLGEVGLELRDLLLAREGGALALRRVVARGLVRLGPGGLSGRRLLRGARRLTGGTSHAGTPFFRSDIVWLHDATSRAGPHSCKDRLLLVECGCAMRRYESSALRRWYHWTNTSGG